MQLLRELIPEHENGRACRISRRVRPEIQPPPFTMYASIRAERAPFSFQRSATCFAGDSTVEPSAHAFASREAAPHVARFASGAVETLGCLHPKAVLFHVEAPRASTVKLVADFTSWERLPLDLRPDDSGGWQIAVPLQPGRYAYRFLVDGEWWDDPDCRECEVNPFGGHNAVIDIL